MIRTVRSKYCSDTRYNSVKEGVQKKARRFFPRDSDNRRFPSRRITCDVSLPYSQTQPHPRPHSEPLLSTYHSDPDPTLEFETTPDPDTTHDLVPIHVPNPTHDLDPTPTSGHDVIVRNQFSTAVARVIVINDLFRVDDYL